jgi:DNA-binding FadR family transcriptional regulator
MALKSVASKRRDSAKSGPTRLSGVIARDIGVQIVSGQLKSGDILHGEIETSGRLHVSRTAYREAVRMLAAKGLVNAIRKIGTRVTPQEEWHLLDPDVLAWIFESEPSEDILNNLFELRRIVEPEAAALAAERRTPEDLQGMEKALSTMSRYGLESRSGQLADQLFHTLLLRSANNVFIASLTAGVGAAVTWTTIYKRTRSARLRDSVPDHQKVYEAIASGDAESARRAMAGLVDLALWDTARASKSGNKSRIRRSRV